RWSRRPPGSACSACAPRSQVWRSCSWPTTSRRRTAMLRDVFTRTLWQQRRSLLLWAGGIAGVTAVYSSFYASARQQAAESVRSLPPAFRQAFGISQMASPAGYLEATVFNFIVPLLVL